MQRFNPKWIIGKRVATPALADGATPVGYANAAVEAFAGATG